MQFPLLQLITHRTHCSLLGVKKGPAATHSALPYPLAAWDIHVYPLELEGSLCGASVACTVAEPCYRGDIFDPG